MGVLKWIIRAIKTNSHQTTNKIMCDRRFDWLYANFRRKRKSTNIRLSRRVRINCVKIKCVFHYHRDRKRQITSRH